MKRILLFALALIAAGCTEAEQSETLSEGSEQVTPSASCGDINGRSPMEDVFFCADQGDPTAQFELGFQYWLGSRVREDDVESMRWYRLAAEQGYAPAQWNLGKIYDNGGGQHIGPVIPQDDVEAVRWYRLAAEQGFSSAQWSLGVMYADGEGVPQDEVLAYMWWNLAAVQGNEIAQENKDLLETRMTPEQIAEGQRLSTEWIAAHPGIGN